ncbi:MAG TPA: 2-oxoglutarate dehydrogenase E1 component [Kofleriaceae bacterium]|nr:2-oxoglutarate dehydrogenase E1 component [Kofleriaceae bacterium]
MVRDILELGSSLGFLDEISDGFLQQPDSIDPSWRELLAQAGTAAKPNGRAANGAHGHATNGANGQTANAPNGASGQVANGTTGPAASGTTGSAANANSANATGPVANGQAANSPAANSANGEAANGTTDHGQAAAIASGTLLELRSLPRDAGAERPGPATMSAIAAHTGTTVWPLVNAYRSRGHFNAKLDPLGLLETARIVELDPATWGFTERDMDRVLEPTGVHGLPRATLGEVLGHLRRVYANTVGLEFMHITSPARRSWLAERMETQLLGLLPADLRIRMLGLLINAEQFERFCHTKYPGTKRFSLEGSESLIPMLDAILTHTARLGAIECVLGLSHRGRLTTLESILRRPGRDLFAQFEDIEPEKAMGGGDVKYHLGFSTDRVDANGQSMHVSLAFNPSHLEAVDPVVIGRVRAKQIRHGDFEHRRVVGVLVHGDAAFAGQGLVPETLQLSGLPGYRTGGTIHVIVNNQVGFTASPAEQRSTPYCTDVAKMLECPIWHVNGEDLDGLARVVEIACEYRAQFASDVVIDMYCFRKYGHNENDEPSFTQPQMYERIKQKASPVEVYSKYLVEHGVVSPDEVVAMTQRRVAELEAELEAAKAAKLRPDGPSMTAMWRGYRGGITEAPELVETKVPRGVLENIAAAMTELPPGFTPHPKIERLLEQRAQMGKGERPLDWGMAELLAYGSLLQQGVNVRMSGQDCARGTFSHRHAIITDIKTGREHLVLGQLHHDQGLCRIFDSPLSEAGVLGFEFGYSLDYPDGLVLWEAQFGDFANGAQVIIDQFIVASEDKWKRLSGIVLLLPHGYEGQGPEHSSARLERYLQSCAEHNIQVAQPTTPAQMFHLLRGQVLRSLRKPLIVMTPKSLLRLPAAASPLTELANGKFHRVLHDEIAAPDQVTRVLFCTGKIYYELAEERTRRGDTATAIVRLEKLYPWWPQLVSAASLDKYPKLTELFWVQDEPCNMGAGQFVTPRFQSLLEGKAIKYDFIARAESASPATGSHKAHVMEEKEILGKAFNR